MEVAAFGAHPRQGSVHDCGGQQSVDRGRGPSRQPAIDPWRLRQVQPLPRAGSSPQQAQSCTEAPPASRAGRTRSRPPPTAPNPNPSTKIGRSRRTRPTTTVNSTASQKGRWFSSLKRPSVPVILSWCNSRGDPARELPCHERIVIRNERNPEPAAGTSAIPAQISHRIDGSCRRHQTAHRPGTATPPGAPQRCHHPNTNLQRWRPHRWQVLQRSPRAGSIPEPARHSAALRRCGAASVEPGRRRS